MLAQITHKMLNLNKHTKKDLNIKYRAKYLHSILSVNSSV